MSMALKITKNNNGEREYTLRGSVIYISLSQVNLMLTLLKKITYFT